MDFAYEELPAEQRSRIEAHLSACPECQAKSAATKATMTALDAWQLPPKRAKAFNSGPGWKWAAAAALVLTTAFAAGRMSTPAVDLNAIARSVEQPIRASVQKDLVAQLTAASEQLKLTLAKDIQIASERTLAQAQANSKTRVDALNVQLASLRDEDRKGVVSLLQEMDQNHRQGLLILRNDLETLAVQAEASFRNAQRQLVQLAGYQQPADQE